MKHLMRWSSVVAVGLVAVSLSPRAALAIPAWARKYNMNCSGCHYPVVPQLNADGLRFKWAGYRMPDEIGKSAEVKRIEDYLALRGVARYSYTKTQGEAADASAFSLPAVSLFFAGPVGKNFGGFFELERMPEGTVDAIGQVAAVWGKEDRFGGIRFVQGHMLVGGAVAGFDRPIGVLEPLPVGEFTTTGVPFSFAGDLAGLEASYVVGKRNRTSLGIVNGHTGSGEGGSTTKKDLFFTNQLLWDEKGGGLTVVGYYGTITGLDAAAPGASSHFYRLAATANKYFGGIGVLGGYVYSKSKDLPADLESTFGAPSVSGSAYWLAGSYTLPKTFFTMYGRYEFLNPDRSATGAGFRRLVLGTVLPVNVPEYLRLGVEYFRDSPRADGLPTRQGVYAEVQLAF